jgi:hypothetical protein
VSPLFLEQEPWSVRLGLTQLPRPAANELSLGVCALRRTAIRSQQVWRLPFMAGHGKSGLPERGQNARSRDQIDGGGCLHCPLLSQEEPCCSFDPPEQKRTISWSGPLFQRRCNCG